MTTGSSLKGSRSRIDPSGFAILTGFTIGTFVLAGAIIATATAALTPVGPPHALERPRTNV